MNLFFHFYYFFPFLIQILKCSYSSSLKDFYGCPDTYNLISDDTLNRSYPVEKNNYIYQASLEFLVYTSSMDSSTTTFTFSVNGIDLYTKQNLQSLPYVTTNDFCNLELKKFTFSNHDISNNEISLIFKFSSQELEFTWGILNLDLSYSFCNKSICSACEKSPLNCKTFCDINCELCNEFGCEKCYNNEILDAKKICSNSS